MGLALSSAFPTMELLMHTTCLISQLQASGFPSAFPRVICATSAPYHLAAAAAAAELSSIARRPSLRRWMMGNKCAILAVMMHLHVSHPRQSRVRVRAMGLRCLGRGGGMGDRW
jgi:hypothetical protein